MLTPARNCVFLSGMSNVLAEDKRQRILAGGAARREVQMPDAFELNWVEKRVEYNSQRAKAARRLFSELRAAVKRDVRRADDSITRLPRNPGRQEGRTVRKHTTPHPRRTRPAAPQRDDRWRAVQRD